MSSVDLGPHSISEEIVSNHRGHRGHRRHRRHRERDLDRWFLRDLIVLRGSIWLPNAMRQLEVRSFGVCLTNAYPCSALIAASRAKSGAPEAAKTSAARSK